MPFREKAMKKSLLFCVVLFWAFSMKAQSPAGYRPSEENLKNREWFRDARFGMFIHWGIYSMLGNGEWVLEQKGLNEKEYQKLASGFYPARYDAEEWVRIAREAGMKYICITSRHHDGFSMFDTRQSDYNIVKATPFKRDVIRELAEACRKEGIKLFFYYSHLDWHRTDYAPLGSTGQKTGRELTGKWEDYLQFTDAQLTELLTQYGPIGGIWFDGWWDKKDASWRLEEQYALIHRLQPGCLIGNNHHQAVKAGEDFQMFERDLPGQNTSGYSGESVIGALPLETCETMNNTWGYNIHDRNYKPVKTLIHLLVKAAGNNANLLLNVGPRPNGEFPSEAVARLKEVGEWINEYGETIYGTRGGCIPPHEWGVTTQKGNKLYVHILKPQDEAIYLPLKDRKVKSAFSYKTRTPLKFRQLPEGVVLETGKIPEGEMDYVVEVEMK